MRKICHLVDHVLAGLFYLRFKLLLEKINIIYILVHQLVRNLLLLRRLIVIVKMVVVHRVHGIGQRQDQNLVRNLRNQLVHLNIAQGNSVFVEYQPIIFIFLFLFSCKQIKKTKSIEIIT